MPYTVEHRPIKGGPAWAKVDKHGHIASRHKTKAKAKAAIRAYYASRNVHNRRNPIAADPTRTSLIHRAFVADINRRFTKLRRAVVDFISAKDALGLKEKTTLVRMATAREFEFQSDPDKLDSFNKWFAQQVEKDVFSVPAGTPARTPWTARYVESAYKKGMLNSYLSSKEGQFLGELGVGDQTQEQFLRSAFQQPEAVDKVRLLATRSFEQLKGVTSTMSSQMNQILAKGMVDGSGPAAIAREMASRIDGLSAARALTIARTEVVNAHAEGQLDAFEKLGVDELGVKAEWSTAGDDRVCEECAAMEGKVFDVEEARGLIPLHPNCRCAWIPASEKIKEAQQRATAGAEEAVAPPRAVLEEDLVKAQAAYDEAKRLKLAPEVIAEKKHDLALAKRAIRRDNKRIAKAGGAPPAPAPVPAPVPAPTAAPAAAPVPAPAPPPPAPVKPVAAKYQKPEDYRKAMEEATNKAAAPAQEAKLIRDQRWKEYEALSHQDYVKQAATGVVARSPETQVAYDAFLKAQNEYVTLDKAAQNAGQNEVWKILRETDSLADKVTYEQSLATQYGPRAPTTYREPLAAIKDVLSVMPAGAFTEAELAAVRVLNFEQGVAAGNLGEYSRWSSTLRLKDIKDKVTTAHEFGHHLSYKIPDIYTKQQAFFEMRTAGEATKHFSGYSRDVKGKKDRFGRTRVYAGRVYRDGRTPEVIAVGVELLYKDAAAFAKADPEYFDMIIGALKRI